MATAKGTEKEGGMNSGSILEMGIDCESVDVLGDFMGDIFINPDSSPSG